MAALREVFFQSTQEFKPEDAMMDLEWRAFLAGYKRGVEDATARCQALHDECRTPAMRSVTSLAVDEIRKLLPTEGE